MFIKKPALVLFFLLILLSLAYNFQEILFIGPYSIHQWRQTDCLSVTLNYFRENLNFLEPSINWIGAKGNGKVVAEFPIIYFIIGNLWKLFGQHESIFRIFNLLIVFTGLYHLYKLFKSQLQSSFWSIFSVLFLFTSPILVYYSNSFIADGPALGLALIACYYIWKYYSTNVRNALYLACVFFLLAGLIKLSSLLIFVALIPFQIYLIIKKRKSYPVYTISPFIIVIILIFAWLKYANIYNSANNDGLFLQGILPIWKMNALQIKTMAVALYNDLLPSFLNITALFIVLFMFIFSLINYKKANKFLISVNVITFAGVFAFIILFFQVFNVHDYYLVNLLIIIPLTILTFLDLIKKNYPNFLEIKSIKTLAVIALSMLIYHTAVINRMKYNAKDRIVKASIFIDKTTFDYWDWYHWYYSYSFKALETVKPYLRSLGIKRSDKVISIPDPTPNISLYLMDQKGFTDFGYAEKGEERIIKFKEMGAKYLIIFDPSLVNQEYLKPFLKNQIGTYDNISIFKL
ncbi:MAG: glycosyltransferase family 39 protein [Bacteroidota bacterium]